MPRGKVVDPRMWRETGLSEDARFWIMLEVKETDDIGDVNTTLVVVHDAVYGRVGSAASQGEVRRPDDTIVVDAYMFYLQGRLSDVEAHRHLLEDAAGFRYNILRVELPSEGEFTRLMCERIRG